MAQQIEPIEIFGCENKGVFLKMYGQHPFSKNLKAEITDVFGNVLFTRILVYGTTEEVSQQLGLTLIKQNNMAQQSSVEWLVDKINGQSFNKVIIAISKEMIKQAKEIHKEDCIKFSIEWENRRDDDDIKSKDDLYDLIYNK